MLIVLSELYPNGIGGRYARHGECSGEEIRDKHIIPALQEHDTITVDLRNLWGFPTSTIEETFGGLVRETKDPKVGERIEFICDDSCKRYEQKARRYMDLAAAFHALFERFEW